MADKAMRMARAGASRPRPVMVAIAGDSAAGKTTLTRGLVEALGPQRCASLCVDDYHRYDRVERRGLPFTALHPDCNHLDIMEQHLQLLATGQPVLKPVYDHATGLLTRPERVEPREFMIVEGLFPLHSRLARACFDVTVFLDPAEDVRRAWKLARDTASRGYSAAQVLAELQRREPDSAAYVRPQRRHADIVVRFAPIPVRDDPPGTPLSAELLLRPTIRHPDLSAVLAQAAPAEGLRTMHLKLARDTDGRPVDTLHVHGYVPTEESRTLQKIIWAQLDEPGEVPESLGLLGGSGARSEPLAITQLLLLHHVLEAGR
ncbi:phosphoribulokinase [Pseudonocardia acidicola]|uniref:phosphoribulokinase n=1 Tax=Pseudonocardia acidicola TaxID=2724939 RepID=A0ABX1S9G5_9PSEU|nr:phosphoribulokinase [Pseudonocardia acidicola]NMH97462.1 phosphoribulokinase [Pseudonocardia acidicola]